MRRDHELDGESRSRERDDVSPAVERVSGAGDPAGDELRCASRPSRETSSSVEPRGSPRAVCARRLTNGRRIVVDLARAGPALERLARTPTERLEVDDGVVAARGRDPSSLDASWPARWLGEDALRSPSRCNARRGSPASITAGQERPRVESGNGWQRVPSASDAGQRSPDPGERRHGFDCAGGSSAWKTVERPRRSSARRCRRQARLRARASAVARRLHAGASPSRRSPHRAEAAHDMDLTGQERVDRRCVSHGRELSPPGARGWCAECDGTQAE